MSTPKSRQSQGFPLSEYFIAGIGIAFILAILIFLVWEGIRRPGRPPEIVTSIKKITALRRGYLAQISITNTGEQTASELKLRAQLNSENEMEVREVTLDYLSPHSRKIIGLFFLNEPTAATLEVTPLSYVEP